MTVAKKLKRFQGNLVIGILIGLLVFWSIGPILWTVIVSVTPDVNLLNRPARLSLQESHLNNFRVLLSEVDGGDRVSLREGRAFRIALRNSIIVSLITTVLTTSISIISGYVFSRFRFPGKRLMLLLIILTMPIPIVVIAIPLIRIMASFNLMDSFFGLSLLYVSFVVPLTTWMATNYIQTIPDELEDAARIDGCSRSQSFLMIVLPLIMPVVGAIGIISFLSAWSHFFLPLIFAPHDAKQLTVVISEFTGRDEIKAGLMAAGGVIAIVPPVIIVVFLNRYIISGLTTGSIK